MNRRAGNFAACLAVACALMPATQARSASFVTFDVPGAGTQSYQGTNAFGINLSAEVSGYYVADEIQMTHRGMMIAIPEDEWVVFHDLPPVELAKILVSLARSVSLPKLQKHPRGYAE